MPFLCSIMSEQLIQLSLVKIGLMNKSYCIEQFQIPSDIKYHRRWTMFVVIRVTNTFCESYSRGLEMSRLLIVNMTLFVNTSNYMKWMVLWGITCSIAHWTTWDNSLHFSMQENDNIEHTNTIVILIYDSIICSHLQWTCWPLCNLSIDLLVLRTY